MPPPCRLWLESVITDESIRLYLDLVKDRYWKLEHCLLRIAKSHVEQRLLYEYGLELTNILPQLLVQSSPGGRAHSPDGSWDARLQGVLIDDDKKETLITRLQFLRLIDRLTTFEVIYDEALFQLDFPFQHRFTSFRDVDLVDQAMEYARDADISALRALIDTEYATLYAFRFAILESMCEVVAPEEYRVLLPGASSEGRETWVTARPSRVVDWVECSVIRRQLQLQAEAKGIFVKTVHLSTDQAVEHPVDNSFLVDWYVRRAIALEESTGMVDHALELVTIAREKGVVDLDRVQERISRIVRFVYDPVAAKLPPSATLDNAFIRGALDNDNGFLMDLFLRRSSGLELHSKSYLVSNDISVHLLPLVDSVDAASHLMDVIHKRSLKDMRWCSLFVQCVQGRPSGVAVYLDDKQLVLFVHRCISCTNRADQWKEIAQLLKIVQRFHQSSARITDTWNDYVVAAELLDRQNIHLTPKQLEDIQQNPTAQHQLITKLARIPLVSHGESSMGEDTVQLLLDAMLRLQKTLCSAVESAEIYERFIAGLLTCGHSSFFGFVRDLLFPEPSTAENRAKSPRSPVDPTKAKSIILNAAREYMENSESANATDPLFKLALECLDVVPVSAISANADLVEAVKNERKFADAIGELCSLSSDLLPIQVLHHSSPIDLIREVIRSSPTLYADTSKVVSLASKLIRVPKLDHIGQISLLSEMVDSAIGHADSHRAYSICLDLVTMVRESREKKRGTTLPSDAMDIVCSSCYQVAREQQFGDSAKRRKLLGYALSFMCTGVGRYACNKSGKVVTSSTILQVWKEMEEVEIAVAIEDQLGIHAKSRVSTVTDKIRDFIRPASVLVDCSAAHRLPRDIFMTGLSPRTPVDSQVIRRRNCQLIGSVFDDDRGCLALLPLSKVWATMRTPASTALLCRAFVEDDFLVGMASAVVDETVGSIWCFFVLLL